MFKFDFTKEEVEKIKSKIYLTDMQERLLEYRLLDYSLTKMAILEHCSETTISRQLKKLREKISKVI